MTVIRGTLAPLPAMTATAATAQQVTGTANTAIPAITTTTSASVVMRGTPAAQPVPA